MITMLPVKLAETGKYLFDLPYCYGETIELLSGAKITRGRDAYYADRDDLSEIEKEILANRILEYNAELERKWNVNQPLYGFPRKR